MVAKFAIYHNRNNEHRFLVLCYALKLNLIEGSAVGKKSSKKKVPPEFHSLLSPIVKIRKEIIEHVFNMARTHKVMSACPCIERFSDDLFDFIHEQYEEPVSNLLYESLMIEIRSEWDCI